MDRPIAEGASRLSHSPSIPRSLQLVIASTFTAESLVAPLKFWMERLQISSEVTLAPYAQVIQELLDPHSAMGGNAGGFNVLLVRPQDWLRELPEDTASENKSAHLQRVVDELVLALNSFRRHNASALLVYLAPSSASLPKSQRDELDLVEISLVGKIGSISRAHCWTHSDLMKLYPVACVEDERSDRIAHIPYTQEYFVGLATLLARRIAVAMKPPYKVIAVDCDNTLWKGVCGEEGPEGVELTPARRLFQELLVAQHDAGMLVCLCTKNNPSDVQAVFRSRPEMPLREEHVVTARVNWLAKSANLQDLARELSLGLESFVFVDDSPLECDEVRTNCGKVLTLQFPQSETEIERFVDHTWAFDRVDITPDAKRRTAQYRENRARTQALEEAGDLRQFLASLQLHVEVQPMQESESARVAELTQRTNQFNLTGVRRRSGELEALCRSGELGSLVVRVRDRFGDYGLVGAVLFRRGEDCLDVETFVMSCRALGRGAEHRVISELGRIAGEERLTHLVLRFRKTSRNVPAADFVSRHFSEFRVEGDATGETFFRVPLEYAVGLGLASVELAPVEEVREPGSKASAPVVTHAWHEAAYRLFSVEDIAQEIELASARERQATTVYVEPRTPDESALADVWAGLLGVEKVGIQDDFFELGGDSLLAVRAIARAAAVLGREVSIADFFESPTVVAIAEKLSGGFAGGPPIVAANRGCAPLAFSQRRLWFIDQLEGDTRAYHIPTAIRLRGKIDYSALTRACNALLRRHDILRTVFAKDDGEPVQRVLGEVAFPLVTVDLSATSPHARAGVLHSQAQEEIENVFDLTTGPLIRGRLLKFADDEHALVICTHHIVSDGWSTSILLRDLFTLYEAFLRAAPDPLAPLPVQFADYAAWQAEHSSNVGMLDGLKYWREELKAAPVLLQLPLDRPRPAVQSFRGACTPVWFGAELTEQLKRLSRRSNVTLAMTVYAAWAILMARLSGQDDIVIGMPVANRPRAELEGLVGFFVNTLCVRVRMEGDPVAQGLLQQVKKTLLQAFRHQHVPFEKVVEGVQPVRTLSHSPIFQTMLVLHNTPGHAPSPSDLTVRKEDVPLRTAQFDLSLSLEDSPEGLKGFLNYATDLFDAATVTRWVGLLRKVLQGLAADLDTPISRIPLLDGEQRQEVLVRFNEARVLYPEGAEFPELFAAQVARTPQALAVVHGEHSLTYAELEARGNHLARHLAALGIRPDDRVGLCVERGLDMLVGVVGILKAGGAYVPLDPEYPAERLRYILEDAAPRALVTQERLRDRLPAAATQVVCLDSDLDRLVRHDPMALPAGEPGLRSHHLAYVLYTSGSTGRPKGVMIEHRHILNLWQGLEPAYRMPQECVRVVLNASFNFDASVQQLVQLLSGRTIYIVDPEVRADPLLMLGFLSGNAIEAIDCTPSQVRAWISDGLLERTPPSLRMVLVGGEEIDPDLWRTLAKSPQVQFYNVYGPTECTVDSTIAHVNADSSTPHIGRPMPNRCIYILDTHGEPVPVGVAGEICIGGAGVARGYFNQAELSAARFVSDPFSKVPGARMYKSGDLGRWRANGSIEYLGRSDHQVKIRGFRIELQEIETQIASYPDVEAAVVLARSDSAGEKTLVAYVLLRDAGPAERAPSPEVLRSHLRKSLPAYMVPSAFVVMERFPMTPNGKIDRKALPAPDTSAFASRLYEAPRGPQETMLASLWQELLRVERVGRHDDFFELGGHSLLAMRLVTRLRQTVNAEVSPRMLFMSPTLEGFARCLETILWIRQSSVQERPSEAAFEEGVI